MLLIINIFLNNPKTRESYSSNLSIYTDKQLGIIQFITKTLISTHSDKPNDKIVHCSVPKSINSVALVRERTVPTKLPPRVGEVSANVCG
jgi:hypothetical protein